MFKYIQIDEHSRIPKYRQIVDSIIHNISVGNLKIDEKIPSINRFSEEYLLSRDTVDKGTENNLLDSGQGLLYYPNTAFIESQYSDAYQQAEFL